MMPGLFVRVQWASSLVVSTCQASYLLAVFVALAGQQQLSVPASIKGTIGVYECWHAKKRSGEWGRRGHLAVRWMDAP